MHRTGRVKRVTQIRTISLGESSDTASHYSQNVTSFVESFSDLFDTRVKV